MSIRVMSLVWHVPTDPNSKLILLALADHGNDEGKGIYPGNYRLAEKVNLSVRQTQYELAHLEAHGLIRRDRHARGGRGRAVEWAVNVPLLAIIKSMQAAAPFPGNHASCDRKGCKLGQETMQPIAPQPSGNIMNQDFESDSEIIQPGETPSQAFRRLAHQ